MTAQRSSLLPALLVVVVVAAAGYWLLRGKRAAAPRVEPAAAEAVAPTVTAPAVAEPPPAPAKMVAVPRPKEDNPHGGQVQRERSSKPGQLTYPDGSTREALNGVGSDVTMLWDTGRPFSPIVDKFTDRGWDWYRHADGSLSTVQIVPVNGIPQVCPITMHPEAAVPVLGSEPPSPAPPQATPQQPGKDN